MTSLMLTTLTILLLLLDQPFEVKGTTFECPVDEFCNASEVCSPCSECVDSAYCPPCSSNGVPTPFYSLQCAIAELWSLIQTLTAPCQEALEPMMYCYDQMEPALECPDGADYSAFADTNSDCLSIPENEIESNLFFCDEGVEEYEARCEALSGRLCITSLYVTTSSPLDNNSCELYDDRFNKTVETFDCWPIVCDEADDLIYQSFAKVRIEGINYFESQETTPGMDCVYRAETVCSATEEVATEEVATEEAVTEDVATEEAVTEEAVTVVATEVVTEPATEVATEGSVDDVNVVEEEEEGEDSGVDHEGVHAYVGVSLILAFTATYLMFEN